MQWFSVSWFQLGPFLITESFSGIMMLQSNKENKEHPRKKGKFKVDKFSESFIFWQFGQKKYFECFRPGNFLATLSHSQSRQCLQMPDWLGKRLMTIPNSENRLSTPLLTVVHTRHTERTH